MALRFVDANVFLQLLTKSIPEQSNGARALFLRVESGEERIVTSPLVLFEVVFTLHSPRSYKLQKEQVVALLEPLIALSGLQVPNKQVWFSAFSVWLGNSIDFTDAFNVATMQHTGLTEIYAWDHGYDKVSGIDRVEPTEKRREAA